MYLEIEINSVFHFQNILKNEIFYHAVKMRKGVIFLGGGNWTKIFENARFMN